MTQHYLLRNQDVKDIDQFEVYEANGGYSAMKQAFEAYTPDELVATTSIGVTPPGH